MASLRVDVTQRIRTSARSRNRTLGLQLAAVVIQVAVKSAPSCGSTRRTGGPIRTGRDPSDRASRWKQLLVAVHGPIAALDARLRGEPSPTLTGPLETAPGLRDRDRCETSRTSSTVAPASASHLWARRDDIGGVGKSLLSKHVGRT
jgi:hypothetical protein